MTTTRRGTYHHGNLAPALVEAGLELAREGGADAVVLREATRRAGVTANAVYRHFANREALVDAVAARALARVAGAIEQRLAAITETDPALRAIEQLRAVGLGYIAFAVAEPGWFDAAFFALADMSKASAPEAAGPSGRSAFQLLSDALDAMADAGVIAPGRREGAEIFCWSTVHGYALLATRGPLREFGDAVEDVADRVVGLCVDALRAGG